MKPPIYDLLMKHVSKQRIKFSSPGHKGKIRMRTDNLCRIDVENIPYCDNSLGINDAVIKSEEEIAGIFGAAKSYYLTSGISAGIYSVLASVCCPGDKIIVDPECDKAVINAITILALQPVFLKRSYCNKYSLNGGISTEKIESAIEMCPDAKMIIVTSPNYYGVCANIKKLSSLAHENNMLLMADESFGAHFNFSSELPDTALDCGADIVIESLSKTLGGFCGGGLLHIAESIAPELLGAIEANLDIYQGDSTSTAMLCALENIIFYAFSNSAKYHSLLREIDRGKEIIESRTNLLWLDAEYGNGCDITVMDKTKIVLNFSEVNLSASAAYDMLAGKYGIEPDYADETNLVFSVSMYNTPSEIRKLINSCLVIDKFAGPSDETDDEDVIGELFDEGPNVVMSPYKAFYGTGELVYIENALGKICRRTVSKLPHGTPIIVPGEKITSEQVEAIKDLQARGVRIHGLSKNGMIEVLTLSDSFYF